MKKKASPLAILSRKLYSPYTIAPSDPFLPITSAFKKIRNP